MLRIYTGRHETVCVVGWYVWRPGGGVGGENQVA